jgi:hypothetical protein
MKQEDLLPYCLLDLFFDCKGGVNVFFRNIGKVLTDYMASHQKMLLLVHFCVHRITPTDYSEPKEFSPHLWSSVAFVV